MVRYCLAAVMLLVAAPVVAAEKARVELTIGAETVAVAAAAQQWYEILTDAGVDGLQIRQRKPGEAPEAVDQGTKSSPDYRIYGVLTARNELVVPGHRFSARDRQRIANWLQQLREEGLDRAGGAANGPFGLTAEQLVALREDFSRPVRQSTVEITPADALPSFAGLLRHEVALEPTSKRALLEAEVNRDELQGLSVGVALTYVVRSAGLAVVPTRSRQGDIVLAVRTADPARESWPVGFEPEDKAEKLVPDIYEFLTVEIEDTTATDVLASLVDRLKLPMLFDHYALARQGIDLSNVKINLPEKRMTYSMVLGKSLAQAKLKYELRVDEANRPFAWITTAQPAR